MTVSGTPGTGTITLGSAVSEYQAFSAAYGANATVDVLIVDGTAWEVARDCTYTHSGTTLSRGTLEASSTGSAISLTSAAVVSVTATAERGNRWGSVADNYLSFDVAAHITYTDSDTIGIAAGRGVVGGKLLSWAATSKDCGPSGTSPMNAAGIKYVYLENSSGTAAFTVSTTAPTWDATIRYYTGSSANQRLIGWVLVWNATTAGTYRIVPFTAQYTGGECLIEYQGDALSVSDQWDSNDARLGSKTSTSTTDTNTALTYSTLIPAACGRIRVGILVGSTVADDNCVVSVSPFDSDMGTALTPVAYGNNAIRLEWANGYIYFPRFWMLSSASGSIYYGVTRAAGTGTVTGYIDCWGGALCL